MVEIAAWTLFAVHGALMFVDEFRFHRHRTMERWERIGHPLDTLTVIAPLAVAAFAAPGATVNAAFIALAVFSSIFITKDEWQHHEHCPAAEQWLHALLFVLHPVLLWFMFTMWQGGDSALPLVALVASCGMLLHQLVYWNVWEPRARG